MSEKPLNTIARLIQQGELDAARSQLEVYLKANPKDANGWYLMSFVEGDPGKQRAALQRALKIAPDNRKAQERLQKLGVSGAGASGGRRNLLLLGGLGVGLVVVLAAVFVLSSGTGQPGDTALPTLAALPTDAPESLAAAVVPSEIVDAAENTPENTVEASATVVESLPTATQAVVVEPTRPGAEIVPTSEGVSAVPTQQQVGPSIATGVGVTPDADVTQVTQPTSTPVPPVNVVASPTQSGRGVQVSPTAGPTITPSVSPVVVTVPVDNAVPLTQVLEIGTGQMRVISATRPGDTLMRELGGSPSAAPSGQNWVLVEAMIICAANVNCSPGRTALQVVGASGVPYSPANAGLDPIFGAEEPAAGQVWGYLAFTVPTSEATLSLVLTQNGQTFAFALQ